MRPVLLVGAALLLGGCGASSAPVATTPLDDGASVSPRRFLADAAAAADAVRDFVTVLDKAGPEATRPRMAAAARELPAPLERARLMAQRLTAAKLVDQRLEAERARVAPALSAVIETMDAVLKAARDSDAEAMVEASTQFAAAVEAAKAAGAP
jgi:hypothetical protein